MTIETAIQKMDELEEALYALGHAMSVLYVDGATAAPKESWKGRGKTLAYLSELEYRKMVSDEVGEVLQTLLETKDLPDAMRIVMRLLAYYFE